MTVRCVLFPLVILAQRNAAKMANNMPQLTLLQMKVTQARQSGNALEGTCSIHGHHTGHIEFLSFLFSSCKIEQRNGRFLQGKRNQSIEESGRSFGPGTWELSSLGGFHSIQ